MSSRNAKVMTERSGSLVHATDAWTTQGLRMVAKLADPTTGPSLKSKLSKRMELALCVWKDGRLTKIEENVLNKRQKVATERRILLLIRVEELDFFDLETF